MEKLPVEELLRQLAELNAKEVAKIDRELPKIKKSRKKEAVRSAVHKIDETLKDYDVSIDEYLTYKKTYGRGDKDHQVEPKEEVKKEPRYVNPSNPEQTWAGRGIMSTWVKDEAKKLNLDVKEYLELIDKTEKKKDEPKKELEVSEPKEQAKEVKSSTGLSRYVNPKNPNQTWDGTTLPRPLWIEEESRKMGIPVGQYLLSLEGKLKEAVNEVKQESKAFPKIGV